MPRPSSSVDRFSEPDDGPDGDRRELERQVHDALAHLNDPVHLQAHPLVRFVHSELNARPSSLGRALHQALLDAVESLRPAEVSSPRALRRYRVARLRFVDGLEVRQVQDRLSLSRSAYFVGQQQAVKAIASLLLETWAERGSAPPEGHGADAHGQGRLAAADRERRPEPTPSQARARTNLPPSLTSFVGREREIAEVRRLLGKTRLLTLTGTGGCGKTRLAYQVADELLQDRAAEHPEECPDGVWVVELASLSDPLLVAQTVAFALGLRDVPGQTILDTIVDHLARRRLLLLLDNCEHLLDACARLVHALLVGCPGVKVLATSREALGIAGETCWRVPSLDAPKPDELASTGREPLSALGRYEAVRLFVERARAAEPSFLPTTENAPAVAQLCRRLDGLPLAIELAATRVRGLSVEQIVAHLDRRFELLTTGSRAALPRQQTLRGTLDWSYELLSGEERAVFRRLGVFSGGFTLEAAEMVAAGGMVESGQVLDLLLRLVDRSLVIAEPRGRDERYRLLDTIQKYALAKLAESGEEAGARDHHRDWYLALAEAESTDHNDWPAPGLRAWRARVEREQDNLRAALDWCRAGGDREVELRLASTVGGYWLDCGYPAEGRALLADVLARSAETRGDARAFALIVASRLETNTGNSQRAKELLEECLACVGEAGGWIVAKALSQLGFITFCLGDPEKGLRLAEEALTMARQLGRPSSIKWASHQVGAMLHRLGRDAEARPRLEESLEGASGVDDQRAVQSSYFLAGVETAEGNLGRARELVDEGLENLETLGAKWHATLGLYIRGDVARAEGDRPSARADYVSGMQIVRESSHVLFVLFGLSRLAGLSLSEGQAQRAARLQGAVAAQYARTGFRLSTNEHPGRERDVMAAKEALGQEAFARAWAEGQAMTLEQAVEYALRDER